MIYTNSRSYEGILQIRPNNQEVLDYVKREIEKINLNIKDVIKGINTSLIGGGLLFLIIVIATIFIYKGGELSILYPIGATSYLWSVIFGYKLFKERLNMWKIMGVIVLLFGVTLVGLGI